MNSEPRNIAHSELGDLLLTCQYSVIHQDTSWDGHRSCVIKQINELVQKLNDVYFGYIDLDKYPEYAKSIGTVNVPACAYYIGSKLVANVIGAGQDIEVNIQILRDGGTPDTSNKLSRR